MRHRDGSRAAWRWSLLPALGLVLLLTGCASTPSHATSAQFPLPPHQTTQTGCPVPSGAVIDDRSTATGFVQSYYDAIDRQDYQRAYAYLLPQTDAGVTPTPAPQGDLNTPPSFADWESGLADTACAILTSTGPESPVFDSTAGFKGIGTGTIVPVALTVVHTDGTIQQFTGNYAIRYDPTAGITQSGAISLSFSQLTPM
jgi:hypothetical protein